MNTAKKTKLSIEFLFSETNGKAMMAVPLHCGLKEADTLLVSGARLVALSDNVVLDISLPALSERSISVLRDIAMKYGKLPVGEFMPTGIADAYSLNVQLAD